MAWTEIELDTPETLKDELLAALDETGIGGVWEREETDPGSVRLVVYVDDARADEAERAILTFFEKSGRTPAHFARGKVADFDWGEEWKRSYTSFRLGDRFFVVPSWLDDPTPAGCTHTIRIDPGEAFGSGLHETTQMTMASLEHLASEIDLREPVFDLGTGSGILAIGARMLGFTQVSGCDNDPVAVRVAAENAELNRTPGIDWFCGSADAITTGSVRVLLANLTADVIDRLFADMDRALQPLGYLVLSGILTAQGEDIRALLTSHGYSIHQERARGEWIALVGRKHGD